MTTTDVATTRTRLSNEVLRAISSPDDVLALYREMGQEATDLSEVLGSGFEVLPTKDKRRLLNVPFVVVEWHYSQGDKGEFVSAEIVTKHEKLVLNDGSSGILAQFHDLDARGVSAPVIVRKGLRVSEFWYDPKNPDAEKSRDEVEGWDKAETYYLAV